MEPTSFRIRAASEDMSVAEAVLGAFAQEHGIPEGIVSKLSVMLDEVLSNIISYAYPSDSEEEIEISLEVIGGRVELAITDRGLPFNPLTSEPPDTGISIEEREIGGVGIHLVRTLADGVTYRREGEKNVLTVVMNLPL